MRTSDGISAVSRLFIDRLVRTRGNFRRLEWSGKKFFSQSDEDGIIAEIFRRIGTTNRVFVEFGAELGTENNTRYLFEIGWTGLWIEGYPDHARSIKSTFKEQIKTGELKFIDRYVTRDNINDLIAGSGLAGEIDFLSVDIDSNDYHVFEAIDVIRPRVVCLEHNHSYPPPQDWVMPHDENYRWDPASGVADFGASLAAMSRLARMKGYELVGCGLYSANGFYVRGDCIGRKFSGPFTAQHFFSKLDYQKILAYPRSSLPSGSETPR
jgi:hypothetical protein